MTRFHGIVGYGSSNNVGGVSKLSITEVPYSGHILSDTRNLISGDKVNDDIRMQTRISIVADAFLNQNYLQIKYVIDAGVAWTVTAAENKRPRIILTLGGVWNGERPSEPPDTP